MLLDAFERLLARDGIGRCGDRQPTGALDRRRRAARPTRSGARLSRADDRRWLGVLSEDEKIRRLAAAEVVCAPSLAGESFGMVLLEAMAAGTVVVASDIEGYRDAAGGDAVLVPPGDVEALAGALAGVLSGRLALSRPTVTGRRSGRRSATAVAVARVGRGHGPSSGRWPRLAEWYEGLYRSAMAGRGG